MIRDRRKTYRVALRPCDRLLISVFPGSELPLLGDVVDLSIEGAGANFSVTPPPLPLGEQVRISLSTRGGPRPVELDALVVSRSDREHGRHYGFDFLQRGVLEDSLNKRLFRLFNRRGQVRLPMEACPAAIRAEGTKTPKTYKVMLSDLSAGGLALLAPREAERELRRVSDVQVRFRVPELDRTLQVIGRIRSRRASVDGVLYGVEFDAGRSRRFSDIQALIVGYLRKREREIMRDPEHAPQAREGEAA